MPDIPDIKNPNAPATGRQNCLLSRLLGRDVRGDDLTRQQASDKIKVALAIRTSTEHHALQFGMAS